MRPSKIDKNLMHQMLRDGKTQSEVAKHFGCTKGAVSLARKSLDTTLVRTVGMDQAHEIITAALNLMKNLKFIMEAILDELKEV